MTLHRRTLALVSATAALTFTAVFAATGPASADPRPSHNPGMTRMHELMRDGNPGMTRMHELMRDGNPGMTRMHELMRDGNPGMMRMHELMRDGNPGMMRMHERMMTGSGMHGMHSH